MVEKIHFHDHLKLETVIETSQIFDVVAKETADGGADADVVRERPHDGEDSGLHLRIYGSCSFNVIGNMLRFS